MHRPSLETAGSGANVAGYRRGRTSGGIEEFHLDANGLRVLFMPQHAAPVAAMVTTYEVGSRHEYAGIFGGSHMLEHMMFKGTPRFNVRQKTSIRDLLHPLGAETNATTWLDRTNYFSLVPSAHLEQVVEIEADRMCNLRIAPADLAAEKEVVLNEHDRGLSDPMERLQQAVWRCAFTDHPYGRSVIGTRDDIAGLTPDALMQYYARHYRPDNATVMIVGDVSREAALGMVHRHFEPLPARPCAGDGMAVQEPPQAAERRVTVQQEGADTVLLAYKTPRGIDADIDALELLSVILASGRLSRLYQLLVATGRAGMVGPLTARLRDAGLFQILAYPCDEAEIDPVERIMRDAIAALRNEGVSDDELDRAKGRLCGRVLLSRDGPLAIGVEVSEAIAGGDWGAYPDAIARYRAVTAADIQRVAHRYLQDRYLTVGHMRP